MSAVTVTIPSDYGYVLLAAVSSLAVCQWQGFRSGGFRKRAGVAYPRPYALDSWSNDGTQSEDAKNKYLFNCAQRAHGQLIEHMVIALPAMLVAGVGFPRASAVLGGLWTVNRVIYAVGYTRADQDKGRGRLIGSAYFFSEIGLMGLIGKMAYDLIMS